MPVNMLSRFRHSPFAFPLAALTALAMFFISETSYRQAATALSQLSTMSNVRLTIQTLRRGLTDAETGERGYLLTGRKEYLEPYNASLADVQNALDRLNAYYALDPVGGPLMKQVTLAAQEKLSEVRETLKVYDDAKTTGRGGNWQELVLSNIGKERMDAVRSVSEQLLELESGKVQVERRGVQQTLLLSRIGVTAMAALSLLALYMYLRQTAALERQRQIQQQLIRAERENLERQVATRTGQLTELAQHLQTVREDERSRLARELHDELGALLTAAKLDVARLKSRLGAPSPEVAERLQHLNDALNSGIALKRRIIEDLRPSSLSNLGLTAALDILTREFAQRTDIEVHANLEAVRLSPGGELTVYRMIQEALTNVTKYGRATQVEVSLYPSGDEVCVAVRDNGVGFDVDRPRASAHGLLGMRYRLEAEGGKLRLTSAPGKGTLIEAVLPGAPVVARSVPVDAGEQAVHGT